MRRSFLACRRHPTAPGVSAWSGDCGASDGGQKCGPLAMREDQNRAGALGIAYHHPPSRQPRGFHTVAAGVAVTALSPRDATQLQGVRAPVSQFHRASLSTLFRLYGPNEPDQALPRIPPLMWTAVLPSCATALASAHLKWHRSGCADPTADAPNIRLGD